MWRALSIWHLLTLTERLRRWWRVARLVRVPDPPHDSCSRMGSWRVHEQKPHRTTEGQR